jgi:hypothetical protein
MNEIIAVRTVLPFLVQAYKRSAHGDGSVICDIVVAVGFSFACTVSEIGFCASWEDFWLLFVRLHFK